MLKSIKMIVSLIMVIAMMLATSGFAVAKENNFTKIISSEKKIPERFITTLTNMGYTYEELKSMNRKELIDILKQSISFEEINKNDISSSSLSLNSEENYVIDENGGVIIFASYTRPSNFIGLVVPGNGTSVQYFHPGTNYTTSNIQSIVNSAANAGRYIFNTNTDTLRTNYFLWGEFDSGLGTHKGVDLKNATNSTAAVRSPITGTVVRSSISGKYINIAINNGCTINFQHLNNITGTTTLLEGKPVSLDQYLGNQNTTDGHVHVQVCAHPNCTTIHSSTNYTTLDTISPYSFFPQY